MSGSRSRRLLLAAALIFGTSACGSTVAIPPGGAAAGSAGTGGLGQVAGSSAGGAGSAAGSAQPAGGTGAAGSAGAALSARTASGSTPGALTSGVSSSNGSAVGQPGGPAMSGFGYNAKTLSVGVTTENDAQATLAAVGLATGSLGDQQAMVKAELADINAQGGVLGRQVVPVFHDVNTAETGTNPAGAAQAACAAFTQDTHVAAALDLALNSQTFDDCMMQHHVFVVSDGLTFIDQAYVRPLLPYYFSLTSPLAERLVPTLLTRLVARGYFSHWDTVTGGPGTGPVRVGLFYLDEPGPTGAFNELATRLQQLGYPVVRYAYARSDSSYENAVLKFKASGVTHIIGDNGSYVLLMRETQSQGYYPRYALTSYNGGAVLLQGNVPSSALAGALGVGWVPTVDVDAAHDPGPTGPAYSACVQTMNRHQVDVSSRAALANALGICDGLQVLIRSMRAGGGFDGPHIMLGRDRFSFDPAVTFSNHDNQGRVDIPSAVRDVGFEPGCNCFVYLSRTNYSLD